MAPYQTAFLFLQYRWLAEGCQGCSRWQKAVKYEKKLKGRETARILNCTICITLCYFLYCSSIATYREDINRGVVRKHVQGAAGLENNRKSRLSRSHKSVECKLANHVSLFSARIMNAGFSVQAAAFSKQGWSVLKRKRLIILCHRSCLWAVCFLFGSCCGLQNT